MSFGPGDSGPQPTSFSETADVKLKESINLHKGAVKWRLVPWKVQPVLASIYFAQILPLMTMPQ